MTAAAVRRRPRGGRPRSRPRRCPRTTRTRAGRHRRRPRSRPGRPSSRPRRARRRPREPGHRAASALGGSRLAPGARPGYPGWPDPRGSRQTPVRDSVRAYGAGRTARDLARGPGRAHPCPARGDGPVAPRPGAALRRERADAVPGRAWRDQPHPSGGHADRPRPGAAPVPAAAPRRGRRGDDRAPRRAPHRPRGRVRATPTRSSRRRCPASAPSCRATRSPPAR